MKIKYTIVRYLWSSIILSLLRNLRFIKNIPSRIQHTFTWEYESCNKCGIGYSIWIDVDDHLWKQVAGDYEICLCPDCFVKKATKLGVKLSDGDLKFSVFQPELHCYK